jgi:hypothetical protein
MAVAGFWAGQPIQIALAGGKIVERERCSR